MISVEAHSWVPFVIPCELSVGFFGSMGKPTIKVTKAQSRTNQDAKRRYNDIDPSEKSLPCPFFFPTELCDQSLWPFPARLPLGAGYTGCCMAPGCEGTRPSGSEVQRFCNLGYGDSCSRLPRERAADANRFFVSQHDAELTVAFCSERQHLPVEHAVLTFNSSTQTWTSRHASGCVQRQAECAVESFIRRREARVVENQNSAGSLEVAGRCETSRPPLLLVELQNS